MIFIGIILGFCVSALIILWVNISENKKFDKEIAKARSSRSIEEASPIKIPIAMIAQDMVPLVSQLQISKETEMFIIGNDADYTTTITGHLLIDGLENWLETGATINYFLLSDIKGINGDLNELSKKYPMNFLVYRMSNLDNELKLKVQNIAGKLGLAHPTIIKKSQSGNAMWLENDHPLGSKYAFNIKFYTPKSLTIAKYFDVFKKYDEIVAELFGLVAKRT